MSLNNHLRRARSSLWNLECNLLVDSGALSSQLDVQLLHTVGNQHQMIVGTPRKHVENIARYNCLGFFHSPYQI